jgi:hypothetical protein
VLTLIRKVGLQLGGEGGPVVASIRVWMLEGWHEIVIRDYRRARSRVLYLTRYIDMEQCSRLYITVLTGSITFPVIIQSVEDVFLASEFRHVKLGFEMVNEALVY